MKKFWYDCKRCHFVMGSFCLFFVLCIVASITLLDEKDSILPVVGFGSYLLLFSIAWSSYRSAYPFEVCKRPPYSQLPEVFHHMTVRQRRQLAEWRRNKPGEPLEMEVDGHKFVFGGPARLL